MEHKIPLLKQSEFAQLGMPSTAKEIRLAIDIAKQANPIFKNDKEFIANYAIKLCRLNATVDRVLRVKPLKRILFKSKIESLIKRPNGKFKVIVKRYRIK